MRHLAVFFSLFALLAACNDTGPTNAPPANTLSAQDMAAIPVQTLRGMYKTDTGGSFFYDCAAGETYRVHAKPAGLDSMYRSTLQPPTYAGEPVFAVVRGKLAKAADGQGLLTLTQIDTLTVRTLFNNCQPYDFWCMGTEPFWGLVISESEGNIVLKQMGEEAAKVFPWVRPRQEGDSWTYESAEPTTGEKITVRLRKETCSDGMSDRMYSYSTDVQLGALTLRGCALK